jgi:hypothetical protein
VDVVVASVKETAVRNHETVMLGGTVSPVAVVDSCTETPLKVVAYEVSVTVQVVEAP